MTIKENKCKEKERYDWYASKENNTDVAWKIAGEPGHSGVYNHTQPQCLVNDVRHSPGLSCRRAPPPRDGRWWLLRWLASVVLHVPLRPHPVDVPRAQTMLLKEDDHRHEKRVVSSRIRFRELSGRREDESNKGNSRMFWKVLLSLPQRRVCRQRFWSHFK